MTYSSQYRNGQDIHSENGKNSDLCRLVINLTDKMGLQRGDKRCQILTSNGLGRIQKVIPKQ